MLFYIVWHLGCSLEVLLEHSPEVSEELNRVIGEWEMERTFQEGMYQN